MRRPRNTPIFAKEIVYGMSGNDATCKKVENFAEHAVRRFVLTAQPKPHSFALWPYGQYAAKIKPANSLAFPQSF